MRLARIVKGRKNLTALVQQVAAMNLLGSLDIESLIGNWDVKILLDASSLSKYFIYTTITTLNPRVTIFYRRKCNSIPILICFFCNFEQWQKD